MQLNVTGHHVDVTSSLKGYVEKKLDRIVRHSDHVIDVHCILTVEKLRHKAEATVLLNGGTVYADAVEQDMYAAIDALADKLDRARQEAQGKARRITTRSRRRRPARPETGKQRRETQRLANTGPRRRVRFLRILSCTRQRQ